MKKKAAFTLIELMIVIAISSLIIISITSAFRIGLLSYEKIDAANNLYQRVRLSLNLIEAELKNVFAYSDIDSKFVGSPGSVEFFGILDAYDQEGKVSPDLGLVRYKFVDRILTRKVYAWPLALSAGSQEEGETFLSGVEEFSWQFAAPSLTGIEPYEWQDSWPKEGDIKQKKELPIAVKINLKLKQKDNSLVEFKKIIPLYQR